jgi:hypothetical protein
MAVFGMDENVTSYPAVTGKVSVENNTVPSIHPVVRVIPVRECKYHGESP